MSKKSSRARRARLGTGELNQLTYPKAIRIQRPTDSPDNLERLEMALQALGAQQAPQLEPAKADDEDLFRIVALPVWVCGGFDRSWSDRGPTSRLMGRRGRSATFRLCWMGWPKPVSKSLTIQAKSSPRVGPIRSASSAFSQRPASPARWYWKRSSQPSTTGTEWYRWARSSSPRPKAQSLERQADDGSAGLIGRGEGNVASDHRFRDRPRNHKQ